ncbi:MAG TPA: hypothetical protein VFB13_01465 [Reyranella sp.]|nr:hypothetical protein [Reyranella sp.]
MAYTLHFDEMHKVLLVRFSGVLTPKDFETLREDTRKFAARHGNCDGIIDFTGLTRSDVDVPYIRSLGRRPRIMGGARRILVAPQAEMFGLSRVYGLHQDSVKSDEPMVVRTLEEALALLELAAPHFVPLEV